MSRTEQTKLETDVAQTPPDYDGQLGDGGQYPTVLETDGDQTRCPYCGKWYDIVTSHWTRSSMCQYPPISKYKMQLMRGLMCGDGGMDITDGIFVVSNTNKTFIEYIQSELGWLSNSISKRNVETQSDIGLNFVNKKNFHDLYEVRASPHPSLSEFIEWYEVSEKVYPDGLSLSPVALKMWYVSDGHLQWQKENRNNIPRVSFTSSNESERPAVIINVLEEHGFTVSHSGSKFILSNQHTEDFFELIGDPVPGFEYKWAYHDHELYQQLKAETKRIHCTQTFE